MVCFESSHTDHRFVIEAASVDSDAGSIRHEPMQTFETNTSGQDATARLPPCNLKGYATRQSILGRRWGVFLIHHGDPLLNMPRHDFTLTDVASGRWHDEFALIPSADLELAGSDFWAIRKQTMRGGLSHGVEVVELDNGLLSLAILPTRGMGIWKGKCGGLDLEWKSPVELPVHPAFVNAHDRGGIGWLGGFNEWICRCGLDLNGPPGPDGTLHGRIANIPAHTVTASIDRTGDGTISVTGIVDESTMFGPNLRLKSTIQTTAGSNEFTVIDEVTNRQGRPAELELLYHINTGRPFLEAGARCVAPAIEVAPRDARAAEGIDDYSTYLPPTAGYSEEVYFFHLASGTDGLTTTLLRNAKGDKGLSISFDPRELPCFALWKNTQPEADGYVTGLEPATNFPNLKAFEREQGRVIRLEPGESRSFRLNIAVHATPAEVSAVESKIAELSGGRTPKMHRSPKSGWSPS